MTSTADSDLLITLAEHVAELTRPIRHIAAYTVYGTTSKGRKSHREEQRFRKVVVPSLLDQLRERIRPSSGRDDIFVAAPYESRTPALLGPLDTLRGIEEGAKRWMAEADLTPRSSVEDNLIRAGLVDIPPDDPRERALDALRHRNTVCRPIVEAEDDEATTQEAMRAYRQVCPYYIATALVMAANRINSAGAEKGAAVQEADQ